MVIFPKQKVRLKNKHIANVVLLIRVKCHCQRESCKFTKSATSFRIRIFIFHNTKK